MYDPLDSLLLDTTAAWGLTLSPDQCARFSIYATELQRWNEHTNLTAITDRDAIYRRHFLDSLALTRFWRGVPQRMIDVGSGAGFPGLPLALAHPTIRLTLVDSVGKKTAFLHHLVEQLQLPGVQILTARAEELGHRLDHRERYDLVTIRAVADLRVLAEYGLPLLRVGGRLLAPKGSGAHAEAEAAARAIAMLGGELIGIEPITLPGLEPRAVVVIDKQTSTDRRYPRPVGVPGKKPL